MNRDPLPDDALDRLLALARPQRSDTSAAEFAFETRLLARLREKRHGLFSYGTVAWRLMPALACSVLLLAYGFHLAAVESDQAEQLAQEPTESISVLGGMD